MIDEPPSTLPYCIQEEHRRTLWSIYLLDKMATCGRYRPSLFLDRTIQLQLPCNEQSFQTSTPQTAVTLENFKHLDDDQMRSQGSFASIIALASTLSQASNYAFKHNKEGGQKPPWDHTSEYQIICSQLTRFETFFDSFGDIQEHILGKSLLDQDGRLQTTESFIFPCVLYHLCHCLLQHPFLLRRRLEDCCTRIPTSFLAGAFESCLCHARELTRTLTNAAKAQHRVSATMLGYCSVVAGSVHALSQHSTDELTRITSVQALQDSFAHLAEKARYWKNSARMVCNCRITRQAS